MRTWFSVVRWRYRPRRVWVTPTWIVLGAVFMSWLLPYLDRELAAGLDALAPGELVWDFDAGVTASTLSSVSSGMIAFAGFVFTVVLLVIQFSTGSLSARLAPRLTQEPVLRVALGMFMATFVYTLLISVRIGARLEEYDPVLSSFFAVGLALASVALFFALLTRVINALRLVKVLESVARTGEKTVDAVHPLRFREPEPDPDLGEPDRTIAHAGQGGLLLGIDAEPVAAIARASGCVVVLVPSVGDYVLPGAPLFAVHGDAPVSERALRRHVVFGVERVVGADPAFALRVLVDIAIKALSPAVNDPTTAVQALDHLGALLATLAGRQLGVATVRDRDGEIRMVHRTSDWLDYLSLGLDEIRFCGRQSVQVIRRLRALLTDLLDVCPEPRRAPVRARLRALDEAIPAELPVALDREIAARPDWQGLGGPT